MKTKLLILLSCMFIVTRVAAESTETISVTFKDFPTGASYAENEEHDLGGGLVIYTTLCHFTEQLRIYSSSTYNGYVISAPLFGPITNMSFRMGYKKDVLNVYGSTDKENWVLVEEIETTSTSYKNYTLNFPVEKGYTCFKLDVNGDQQIRIESMSITYIKKDDSGDDGGIGDNPEEDDENDKEEDIVVSAPVFNPVSISFSTESLNVAMAAAEGCDIYYTKDGSNPSYVSANVYNGTKGNAVTIYASESKVTLQAIAVDPATGECSDISSATYTYVEVKNDGSKSKPYTVAELRTMSYSTNKENLWVRGTICGALDGNNRLVTSGITIETNIAIGDENAHVAVQLPSNSKLRNHANLKDHPYMMGKELLVKGDLVQYLVPFVGVTGPTDYEISYNVPINSYGCATLFLDMPVALPSGAMAYYCTAEGDKVQLLPIEGVIPDSVGVILEYLPNETCRLIYTTEVNVIEDSIRKTNQLVGFTRDVVVEADGNAYYALNVKDNVLGFYIPQTAVDAEDAASGFTAKANKAYLSVPAAQKSQRYVIRRLGNETAVVLVPHLVDDRIYDLQGRVVTSPDPGIYIRAGKKVVIR
jgi:hypothetical protein